MQEYVYKKVESKAKHIRVQEAYFRKNIKELDPRESYKYLGIEENHDTEHNKGK